jgi:hypothetical protein
VSKCCIIGCCQSVRPWSSFLAADSFPCVEKLRTVYPLTVGIRDGVVQLVLTHQRVRTLWCVRVGFTARVGRYTQVSCEHCAPLVPAVDEGVGAESPPTWPTKSPFPHSAATLPSGRSERTVPLSKKRARRPGCPRGKMLRRSRFVART